jgi:cytoskeletal protein RodZ
MVLAYLLYRAQQRDQAATAAAATDQAAQDASANTAADPYNTQLAEEWLQASQLNNPAASATAATTPTTASSTSSGVDLGGPLVDTSSNDALLANIVAAYSSPPSSGLDLGGPLNLSSITPEQLAAMTIPAISGTVQQATGNIPTTAQDAAAQAMLAIAPNLYNYAMDSNSGVSSHPVDPIPTGPYSPGQNPVYIPGTNTLDPIQPLTLTAHPITQAGA